MAKARAGAAPGGELGRWPCLSMHGAVLWLAVSVQPGARRTAADGWFDGTLRIRLVAPPVDGQANELLVAWVAEQLALPRRAVSLVRGQTARRKWLAIDAPLASVSCWFEKLGLQPPAGNPP